MASTETAQANRDHCSSSRVMRHVAVGIYLGGLAYISIISRSLSPAIFMISTAAFFAVPGVVAWMMSFRGTVVRYVGLALLIGWSSILLLGLLRVIDHLYMVNGSSYPISLARTISAEPEQVGLISGPGSLCEGHGFGQFYPKSNGMFLRCGAWGFMPITFFIENFDEATEQWLATEAAE